MVPINPKNWYSGFYISLKHKKRETTKTKSCFEEVVPSRKDVSRTQTAWACLQELALCVPESSLSSWNYNIIIQEVCAVLISGNLPFLFVIY